MSFIVANTYKLQSCSCRALQYNLHLFKLLADLNDVPHWVPECQHVFLQDQPNYFSLLPPEHLSGMLNLEDRNHYPLVKQRSSDAWHQLHKKTQLTGSTMYKALGLETLKVQKEHFYVHVKGKQAKTVTPEVQRMMDYGTENEIHAIVTLVALILPTVRPPCFSVYELGSFSMNGNIKNLLIASPDGLAQCSQGENCQYKQSYM